VRRVTAVAAVIAALQVVPTVRAQDSAAILAATREALGGEKRITSVKTIVATGRTRQVRGDNLVPIEFEIAIELPDKYVRTDEIPAQDSGPTRRGFNGSTLIQFPDEPGPPARGGPPPPPRAGGPPPGTGRAGPTPPIDPVTALKQDFVRLTLGMFATSLDAYPLTFSYGGGAEAPEGRADVIMVKGQANFEARLFIDSRTHLPVMFSSQNGPLENRTYYADYRDVDGLKFPFRLRRANGATTFEETTFDRFRINTKIDPKKFEARR
jgi:hypothetical protein